MCLGSKMYSQYIVLVLCVINCAVVRGATLNETACPDAKTMKVDLKALDGKWFFSTLVSDLNVEGNCAMVTFKHDGANTTDVYISWVNNKTISYTNGSAKVVPDGSDGNTTSESLDVSFADGHTVAYSFLDVNYDHYAVAYACNNSTSNANSTMYELWVLTRTQHIKSPDLAKINEALSKYNLKDIQYDTFNNTKENCEVNSGSSVYPSFVLSTFIAVAVLKTLY